MKYFNNVFDIFLYQGIFTFLIGASLFVLNDPISDTLISLSIISAGIAIVLGCIGYYFRLFAKERDEY